MVYPVIASGLYENMKLVNNKNPVETKIIDNKLALSPTTQPAYESFTGPIKTEIDLDSYFQDNKQVQSDIETIRDILENFDFKLSKTDDSVKMQSDVQNFSQTNPSNQKNIMGTENNKEREINRSDLFGLNALKKTIIPIGLISCGYKDFLYCPQCKIVAGGWGVDADPSNFHEIVSPECLNLKKNSSYAKRSFIKYNENIHRKYPSEFIVPSKNICQWKRQYFSQNSSKDVNLEILKSVIRGYERRLKDTLSAISAQVLKNHQMLYVKINSGDPTDDAKFTDNTQNFMTVNSRFALNLFNNTVDPVDGKRTLSEELDLEKMFSKVLKSPMYEAASKVYDRSIIRKCWNYQRKVHNKDFETEADLVSACERYQHTQYPDSSVIKFIIKCCQQRKDASDINLIEEITPKEKSEDKIDQLSPAIKNEVHLLSSTLNNAQPIIESNVESIDSLPTTDKENSDTIEENNADGVDSNQSNTCIICMEDERQLAFIPCGHMIACVPCGHSVTACPICRTEIKALIRIYL